MATIVVQRKDENASLVQGIGLSSLALGQVGAQIVNGLFRAQQWKAENKIRRQQMLSATLDIGGYAVADNPDFQAKWAAEDMPPLPVDANGKSTIPAHVMQRRREEFITAAQDPAHPNHAMVQDLMLGASMNDLIRERIQADRNQTEKHLAEYDRETKNGLENLRGEWAIKQINAQNAGQANVARINAASRERVAGMGVTAAKLKAGEGREYSGFVLNNNGEAIPMPNLKDAPPDSMPMSLDLYKAHAQYGKDNFARLQERLGGVVNLEKSLIERQRAIIELGEMSLGLPELQKTMTTLAKADPEGAKKMSKYVLALTAVDKPHLQRLIADSEDPDGWGMGDPAIDTVRDGMAYAARVTFEEEEKGLGFLKVYRDAPPEVQGALQEMFPEYKRVVSGLPVSPSSAAGYTAAETADELTSVSQLDSTISSAISAGVIDRETGDFINELLGAYSTALDEGKPWEDVLDSAKATAARMDEKNPNMGMVFREVFGLEPAIVGAPDSSVTSTPTDRRSKYKKKAEEIRAEEESRVMQENAGYLQAVEENARRKQEAGL